MKSLLKFVISSVLVASIPLAAHAQALTGNCRTNSVPITTDGKNDVTLVRLWNEDSGEWEDADASGTDKKEQSGGYWYKFTVPVGSDCVLYIDPATVISDNGGFYIGLDIEGGDDVYSLFRTYDDDATGITYWYLRASDWEEESSQTATFYARISGDYPGVKCAFYHYFKTKTIADFAPAGSELSPVQIDVSRDGSRPAASSAATVRECWYTTSLAAGRRYVFTCTPGSVGDNTSVDVIPADDDVDYDYSTYVDTQTGVCTTKILPHSDVDASIMLMASSLTNSVFSWRQTLVGSIGFSATSITVSDTSGVAVAKVRRDSNDVAHRIRWMTVAETAEAGIDYTPASGELLLEADGDYSADIEIPLVPGASVSGGDRSFAIRLEPVPEDELGDEEYSPAPSPRIARVLIAPTGEGKPAADVPAADDENPETPLSTGTFCGVCAAEGYAALVRMTALADGTASAVFGDSEYVFGGDTNELSCVKTLKGLAYTMYLTPTLPSGAVEDLDESACGPASLRGSIYAEGASGGVEELFVEFELYREESRLDSAVLERMEEKAGRYTVSLAPVGDEWSGASRSFGYLTIDVAASGETSMSGIMPGDVGARVSASAAAYDTELGLAVPFVAESDGAILAGTLRLEGGECELASTYGRVAATGGEYDYWTDLTRLYNGWILAADETCVLKGLDINASEDGGFVASGGAFDISLDRATGVLTGTNATYSFSAVILNYNMAQDAVGAEGGALDANGNSYPVSFLLDWTDPGWTENWDVSVTVSFDGNGGSGTPPAGITASLGATVVLPENTFSLEGNVFGGWMNPDTMLVHAAGEAIKTPADNVAFKAYWIDRRVNEALDCELDFSADNWNVSQDAGAVNSTCMKGLVQKDPASGTLSTSVDGSGTLTWRWKLVRRYDSWTRETLDDTMTLKVDGVVVATLSGADYADFVEGEYEIAGRSAHSVAWEYNCMDKATWEVSNSGSACTAVDCVAWTPKSTDTAVVTFNPGEGATVTPSSMNVKIGNAIGRLPVPECDTRDFVCWTNSSGVVATEATVVSKRGLDLYAQWEGKSWSVSFAAGGAVGDAPAPLAGKEGEKVALPDEGSLSMGDDYEFGGWTDGSSVYAAASNYTVPSSNVTLTATWADARVKNALDTDLNFSAENWNVSQDAGAVNSTCMKGLVQKDAASGTLSTSVSGSGTLTWHWKLVRRTNKWGNASLDDMISLKVDGVVVATLSGADNEGFVEGEYEISGQGTHAVAWEYSCMTVPSWGVGNSDSACTAVDCVTWTAAAPVDFSDAVVTETTTPADLGITNGTFAAESAGSTNLVKLVAWAKANDITVAEVNDMAFTAGSETTLEAAYLLDCSKEEVEARSAEFAVTEFSVSGDGSVSISPADGSDYGNGHVEIRSSEAIDGEYTAEEKTGRQLFFRLYLVK